MPRPIIDSHLDLAWNAISWRRDLSCDLGKLNANDARYDDLKGRGCATVSLPEMAKGNVRVCLATLMARVPYGDAPAIHSASLDYPCHDVAYAAACGQLAYYRRLEEIGLARVIQTKQQLLDHWQLGEADGSTSPLGIIVAMEGTDAIVQPGQAEHWYQLGLRCASLVHYGRSAYAVGTGDDGPLTDSGRELLTQFESLGVTLDVTHLSDTSFFEAMDNFGGNVLASHQNCRTLVPGQRQFSDEQLRIVIERGGVIGASLDAWMLYPGYQRGKTSRQFVPLQNVVDHYDHICQLAGNSRHIAIGSDLDGGYGTEQCPIGLDSIADLQKLAGHMSDRGYTEEDINAAFHGNWLRLLTDSLPG